MSLVSDVRVLIDEASAAFWTDAHVYNSLNATLLDMYQENARMFIGTATITTTASNSYIPIPSTIMIPKLILGTGKEYWGSTQTKFNQYNSTWPRTAVGYPRHWSLWDASTFQTYPRPDAAYVFQIAGVPWPDEITSTNTDLSTQRNFTRAVMYRAAAHLMEVSRPDLSDYYTTQAIAELTEFKRLMRSYGAGGLWTLTPRTHRVAARSGVVRLGRIQI